LGRDHNKPHPFSFVGKHFRVIVADADGIRTIRLNRPVPQTQAENGQRACC
jgi:hypothetical protein